MPVSPVRARRAAPRNIRAGSRGRCSTGSTCMSTCRRWGRAVDLALPPPAEGAAAIARRVAAARARQAERFARLPAERRIRTNAEAEGELLTEIAEPDADGRRLLAQAAERLRLSARGYHRDLRDAGTLEDI